MYIGRILPMCMKSIQNNYSLIVFLIPFLLCIYHKFKESDTDDVTSVKRHTIV